MQSGTGYGAVNIQTPTEVMDAGDREKINRAQSQLASATLPDEVKISGNKAKMSDLALVDATSASQVKNTGNQQALIANAASLATTPDEWDQAMQDLADKGVPAARQFIGRYSEQLKGRITNAYSASSPSSALAAMQSDNTTGAGGAQSGLADVAGGAGAGVQSGVDFTAFDQKFAHATPEQLQTAYQHLEKMRNALQAVAQSPNPAAEWDKHAAELGHPEQVGHYSPQTLQQITQDVVPLDNYLRGRMTRDAAGVTPPQAPAKVDNVGGALYAVDTTDPANPTAKAITPQGKGTLVGTDPETGVGIYYDPVTGKETRGTQKLAAKPGAGAGGRGGNSVFAMKQAAWLQAHPGDVQGALDYAGSLKGKNLSAEQIQLAATTAAARELGNLSLAGTPPPDPQAYLTSRVQEIAQDIGSRGPTATSPSGAAPSAIPTRALAVLKDGKPHEFHVGGGTQTWQIVGGQPKRLK